MKMANKCGKVSVALTKVLSSGYIPVINTEISALDTDTEGKIVTRAVIDYHWFYPQIISKKINSTFIGSISIEVKSAEDSFEN